MTLLEMMPELTDNSPWGTIIIAWTDGTKAVGLFDDDTLTEIQNHIHEAFGVLLERMP